MKSPSINFKNKCHLFTNFDTWIYFILFFYLEPFLLTHRYKTYTSHPCRNSNTSYLAYCKKHLLGLVFTWLFTTGLGRRVMLELDYSLLFVKETFAIHACLEHLPTKKKFLRQVFNILLLYCIPIYSDNWFWNQNQAKFWENANLIFFNVKYWPIFACSDPFFASTSIFFDFWDWINVPNW